MRRKTSSRPWILVMGLGIILIGIYLLLDPMYFYFVLLVLAVWQGIATRRHMVYLASLLIPSLALLMVEHSVNHSLVGTTMLMIAFIIIVWQAVGVTLISPKDLLKYFLANVAGIMIFMLVHTRGEIFTMSPAEWISNNSWWLSTALIVPVIGVGIGLIGRTKPVNDGQDGSNSVRDANNENQ